MKTVAILQSNYIPWKGYFDMIASVDEFVLFDDMQFTRRDWRNRNQIKTPQGVQWLTVPVQVKGRYEQRIRDTLIAEGDWAESHWKSLVQNYRRAACFDAIASWLEPLYLAGSHTHISSLNRSLIEAICGYLGIRTRLSNSWDYAQAEGRTERLAEICRQAGATRYVSGPAAQQYLDVPMMESLGIEVVWFDYGAYPAYPQLWGPFVHGVSILDLLFNCGDQSHRYMKHVRGITTGSAA